MFETFRQQMLYSEIGINTVIGGSGDPVQPGWRSQSSYPRPMAR
jgi:hypothetical protein